MRAGCFGKVFRAADKLFPALEIFAGESADGSFWSLELKALLPEPLQFVEQRAAADAEGFRGFRAVGFVLGECRQNRGALHFVQLLRVGQRRGSV